MNASQFEKRLTNDARFKEMAKRGKIFRERWNAGKKNQKALFIRMETMENQVELDSTEIDELKHEILESDRLMIDDRYQKDELEEAFPISADNQSNQQSGTQEWDEIAISGAIDKCIFLQQGWLTKQEKLVVRSEVAQARIKELLDFVGK